MLGSAMRGGTTTVRRGLGGTLAAAEALAAALAEILAEAWAEALAGAFKSITGAGPEAAAMAEADGFFWSARALFFTAISFSRSLTFFSSSLTRLAASATCFSLAILSSTAMAVLPPAGAEAGLAFDSFSWSFASLTGVARSSTLAVILPATLWVASGSLAGALVATWPASLLR